jgi:hypothetical protein
VRQSTSILQVDDPSMTSLGSARTVVELELSRKVDRSGKTLPLLGHGLAAVGRASKTSRVFTAPICLLYFGLLV